MDRVTRELNFSPFVKIDVTTCVAANFGSSWMKKMYVLVVGVSPLSVLSGQCIAPLCFVIITLLIVPNCVIRALFLKTKNM